METLPLPVEVAEEIHDALTSTTFDLSMARVKLEAQAMALESLRAQLKEALLFGAECRTLLEEAATDDSEGRRAARRAVKTGGGTMVTDEQMQALDEMVDSAAQLDRARRAAEERAARLELRVAQLRGLLEHLLEEFQDRQDITDSGGPDWCMRSAMRIESTLAEGTP